MTPRRLWVLVSGAGCAAVLCAGVAAVNAWEGTRPPAVHLLAVVAVVLVGDISLLRIRVGHNGNSFTWAEASIIVGVAIAGWDWLIAIGTLTVFLRQVAVRRPAYKALYNAGSFASGAMLGRVAYFLIAGTWDRVPQMSWRDTIGLLAAACVYFLWVSFAIAVAVAWAQDLPIKEVWRRGSRLRGVMFAGNSAAGVATVLIGDWNRPTIVVLPFFFLMLYLAYNNFLRAQQERDTWRDLHTTTLHLQRVDTAAVIDAVRRGADTLFGSERTEVVFAGDPRIGDVAVPALAAYAATLDDAGTVRAHRAPTPVGEELAALDLESAVLAPLSGMGHRLGFLLLGFRGPVQIKPRERGVLATLADQTSISLQQARLFEQLTTERSRLDAIVQSASDGILLIDAAGRVCAWNPAMARLTGRREDDVLGRPLEVALDAVSDDGRVEGGDLIAQLAYQDDVRLSCVVPGTDEAHRDVVLAVSAVRDRDGACEYAVVVARDVTSQREVEQAKQDFIATVSHELRTPLTPIKGYLSMLLRPDFRPDEDRRDGLLRIMLDQAGQLERLVDDLLSVSRMQHGEFSVHVESTDVVRVLRRAVDDIAAGTDRQIDVDLPGYPLVARCDPARLHQIVANLLSNADKYSPRGRPVHLCARLVAGDGAPSAAGDAVAGDGAAGDGGPRVEIAVRDHGSGIPADARETVFEPFRRLGDSSTRATRGTGLGLHIARQLVEAMDGRIFVDGEPGEGAVFHVVLPAGGPYERLVPEPRQYAEAR